MDIDPCPSIYDEFPSFLSQEGCNLNNFDYLDEILDSVSGKFDTQSQQNDYRTGTFASYPSPPTTVENECDSPIDFNPDEFLNFLPDDDDTMKEERHTPSPVSSTVSSVSGDSHYNTILDTPPISPENNAIQLAPQQQPTTINFLQGTLIPIQTVPLSMAITPQSKAILPNKPKTIVLSAKDYTALMQKVRSTPSAPPQPIPKIVKPSIQPVNKLVMPKVTQFSQKFETAISVNHQPQVMAISVEHCSPFLGMFDEKVVKKQQRMIKNRESASLSRKKKKDYVTSLEHRIGNLEKENVVLKEENTTLRSQLTRFAQSCQCNHNKITEFVSSKFTKNKASIRGKILNSSRLKKNTTVLLAMVFMVSLNFGKFNTYFTPNLSDDDSILSGTSQGGFSAEHAIAGRRSLLWYDRDENLTSTEGPLNFNETMKFANKTLTKCPMMINQTENMRLASELRKWIVVNDFHNLSSLDNVAAPFKLPSEDYLAYNADLKKLFKNSFELRKLLRRNKRNAFGKSVTKAKSKKIPSNRNPLQLFKPKTDDEYTRLFEGIRRRDDTFYVVSFNSDHILLPASAYNKSSRPKMSLMLPAGDGSLNGKITLMQIDCEVINTTLVNLTKDAIPENLRPRGKFNVNESSVPVEMNATRSAKTAPIHDKVEMAPKSHSTDDKLNQYRPYFMPPIDRQLKRRLINANDIGGGVGPIDSMGKLNNFNKRKDNSSIQEAQVSMP